MKNVGSTKKAKNEKKKSHGMFENAVFLKLFVAISTESSYLSMLLNTAVRERQVNSTVAHAPK